jgi:hypothetical protein
MTDCPHCGESVTPGEGVGVGRATFCRDCFEADPSDGVACLEENRDPVFADYSGVAFDAPGCEAFPDELAERERWMGAGGSTGKQPFAPWADRNHADADDDEDARWKWGLSENYTTLDETTEWVERDPRVDGRTFMLTDDGPYAFVDGDDVRDPETGEVHPAFVAILEHLGLTYADISTSGGGVHAYYRGGLPDGVKQAVFEINSEPWGENDDAPTVEMYAKKHVCVATGKHVPGTPTEVAHWDSDALHAILDAAGQLPAEPAEVAHDTDRDLADLDGYDPTAIGREDTADDLRDVLAAVDRLRPRDLPLEASKVGSDSTGWEKWDPSSYRSTSGHDSLHRPPGEPVFHDHKTGESFGVLSLFAAEQDIIATPGERLAGSDWWEAVEAAREAGAPIPEFDSGGQGLPTPVGEDVTLDPREAWRAASAVGPDDLGDALGVNADGDGWVCPDCGTTVSDAVRALALGEGELNDCEGTLTSSEYDRLYRRLREEFDAPLPEYVSARTATEDMDLALGAVGALRGWHVLDAAESSVTVEDPRGEDAVAVLDPSWEDSESGERVVLFASGAFWCREHEQVFDPLRFVALESGLLDSEAGHLEGDAFLDAYRTARLEYDAPLPALSWNTEETDGPEHVPVLPDAEELVGEGFTTDRGGLDDARDSVEELYRSLAADSGGDHVLTALPALGKTTSVIKHADEFPSLYTAGRKELMADAVEKAAEFDVSAYVLPVLAEHRPPDEKIAAAASVARREGKDLLRDPTALLEAVGDWDDCAGGEGNGRDSDEPEFDGEAFGTLTEQRRAEQRRAGAGDDDPVVLPRESCTAANGGDDPEARAWQLAVHVASELGHTPREIHQHAKTLFGSELPCQRDGDCPYTLGWERATDPDQPFDLLVGHYTHAHPDGARTYLHRENDRVQAEPRVVAIDEFPDDTYTQRFGEEYLAHATWLARCLREDVADREGLLENAGALWDDEFVRAWLSGEVGDDVPQGPAADALQARRHLADALRGVDDLRQRYGDLGGAESALGELVDCHPQWGPEAVGDAHERLHGAAASLENSGGREAAVADDLREDVLAPLAEYMMLDAPADPVATDDHVSGDLAALVERALDAWRDEPTDADGLLETALTAVRGGVAGVEALAAGAADGDAHPAARLLLFAHLAPDDSDAVRTVETAAFDFQAGEGSRLKCIALEGQRAVLDRNHRGALLHTPPAFDRNSTVGLDATGRAELWSTALLADVETSDIHDSAAERRAFLRDALNLQVVQSSPHINSWEGDPQGKDLGSATALVEAVADEFDGYQLRQDRLSSTTAPGVITTKCVRDVLEEELYAAGAGAVENYGNMTGSNALGERNVGAVLGCQHFGDTTVEKWAALAGEQVEREGHGHGLDYNSEAANAYLKRMREDRTMQAILRFGRDEEGAVVFAHTAALRDDLPVEADAEVVRAFSPAARQLAHAARSHREEFTVADVVDDVDVEARQVRRVLNEFADLGYLDKREVGAGRANHYATRDEPRSGEVSLPDLDLGSPEPGQNLLENTNTGYVWVDHADGTPRQPAEATGAMLTSPDAFAADTAPAPPG